MTGRRVDAGPAAQARLLMAYNAWANARVMERAALLSDAELDEPHGASFGSIRGNLQHLLMAQQTWHERWTGTPRRSAGLTTFAGLREELSESDRALQEYAERMTDEDWSRVVAYRTTDGEAKERLLGHLVTHLVNHGTFHRGETGMMLALHGQSPGDLDMVLFIEEWAGP